MDDLKLNPVRVLEKIKSRGYWEVVIRPMHFEKERINDLIQCLKIVEECKIMLRGWDYPHISNKEPPYCGIDYFESVTDWDAYKEFWRMYQSGQFVHLFGLHEDWFEDEIPLFGPSQYSSIKPGSILEVSMTLYSLTEIFQFATNLARKNLFDESAFVSIKLHGLMNRTLQSFDFGRRFWNQYTCHINSFPIEKEIPVKTLLEKNDEIALTETFEVFKRFNWASPPKDTFKTDQLKLIERKI